MTHTQKLQEIPDFCRMLGADVCFCPESGHLTALVWEADGEKHALSVQRQIQRQAAKYPGLVCYCFDTFSTLVYEI